MCASRPPKTAITSETFLGTTQPETLCHRNFILLIVVPCKAFGVVVVVTWPPGISVSCPPEPHMRKTRAVLLRPLGACCLLDKGLLT